jgi:hypothetical protein
VPETLFKVVFQIRILTREAINSNEFLKKSIDFLPAPCAEAANGSEKTEDIGLRSYFVENLKMVVVSNFSSGRRTVEGKCGLLGESGKCWVSRQKLSWRP